MSLSEVLPKVLKSNAFLSVLRGLRRTPEHRDTDQVAQRLDRLSGHCETRLPPRGYIKG